jgi:N-acetylmuramoyl-L-alanine amidase
MELSRAIYMLFELLVSCRRGVRQGVPLRRGAFLSVLRSVRFCLFAAMLVGVSSVVSSQELSSDIVTVTAVRTSGDNKESRFVLDVSKPIAFSVFALADPYRLVIDLPSLSFQMAHGMGQVERAMVRNFRFGSFGETRSRVVLDLSGPAKVSKAYNLPAVDGNAARAVIELVHVSEREFSEQALRDVIRIKADGKSLEKTVPVREKPIPEHEKGSDARPLVVLDPGHGGIDTGATSKRGLKESKLVLSFAKALKKKLEADGHVRVVMTREKDEFISLSKRVAFAQAHNANLFVSIHADTVRESYVRGATVYTLSDRASDQVAAKLAQQENRSDLLAGLELEEKDDVVADILIDLTRRETANHSSLYSRTLVGALKSSIKLSKTPERSAGFKVLKAPDIPSILLELGYLSNDADQSALTSEAWRKKAIDSIAKSLRTFFQRQSANSSGLFVSGSG